MNKNLYRIKCKDCGRSYLSADKDKFYCTSHCETRHKHPERYRYNKKQTKKKDPVEKKPVISEQQRWLNKKSISDRKKQHLDNIMYRDTFKKYIPKNLKVMRG